MTSIKPPVKTLRAKPEHGPLGVLVDQSSHLIYPHARLFDNPYHRSAPYAAPETTRWGMQLVEVVDTYLSEIIWEKVPRESEEHNHTTNKTESIVSESFTTTVSKSTEKATNTGFEFKIKGIGIDLGSEYKTFSSYEETKRTAQKYTITINPGETLYSYRLAYHFNIRVWWIAEYDGVKRIVTQSATYENTHYGNLQAVVYNGGLATVTRLDDNSAGNFDAKPITKSYKDLASDAQMARSKFSELPEYLRAWVEVAWARASENPQPEVKGWLGSEVGPPPQESLLPPLW